MASEIVGDQPQAPSQAPDTSHGRAVRPGAGAVDSWLETLSGFWTKLNHEGIFNLAGLLAHNFLMALFPLLLAGCGVVLQLLSPHAELQQSLAAMVPGPLAPSWCVA